MRKLVIIGASGHGKVIADIAVRIGYEQIVFLDDNEEIKECAGFAVVGKTSDAINFEADKIIAIGNATIRQKFSEKIKTVTLIHPNAIISRRVEIGEGTVVMAGAVINSDSHIGNGCIINTGASVDHDCKLEDYVHVAGTCSIGKRTWVGAGTVVSNNLNVCADCMIGAGAVVVNNIEQSGTYVGVPAKYIGEY